MKAETQFRLRTVIIGGGISSLGIPIAADRHQQLTPLLENGLVIINPTYQLGLGGLNNVRINSNSGGNDFPEHVASDGVYQDVMQNQHTRRLQSRGNDPVPLPWVVAFTKDLGKTTGAVLESHPNEHTGVKQAKVEKVIFDRKAQTYKAFSHEGFISEGENLVFATGGKETLHNELNEYANKVIFSGTILQGDLTKTELLLKQNPKAPITIIGASHSAFAMLKELVTYTDAKDRSIVMIYNYNPPTAYFKNLEEYDAFIREAQEKKAQFYPAIRSVDPQNNSINRFEGVRNEAKDLLKRIVLGEFPNITFQKVTEGLSTLPLLKQSAFIGQATGLASERIPIYDTLGQEIGPYTYNGQVLVDDQGRLLDHQKQVLHQGYGIGIGYSLRRGSIALDGVNFYYGQIGDLVLSQLLPER